MNARALFLIIINILVFVYLLRQKDDVLLYLNDVSKIDNSLLLTAIKMHPVLNSVGERDRERVTTVSMESVWFEASSALSTCFLKRLVCLALWHSRCHNMVRQPKQHHNMKIDFDSNFFTLSSIIRNGLNSSMVEGEWTNKRWKNSCHQNQYPLNCQNN